MSRACGASRKEVFTLPALLDWPCNPRASLDAFEGPVFSALFFLRSLLLELPPEGRGGLLFCALTDVHHRRNY